MACAHSQVRWIEAELPVRKRNFDAKWISQGGRTRGEMPLTEWGLDGRDQVSLHARLSHVAMRDSRRAVRIMACYGKHCTVRRMLIFHRWSATPTRASIGTLAFFTTRPSLCRLTASTLRIGRSSHTTREPRTTRRIWTDTGRTSPVRCTKQTRGATQRAIRAAGRSLRGRECLSVHLVDLHGRVRHACTAHPSAAAPQFALPPKFAVSEQSLNQRSPAWPRAAEPSPA